MKLLGSFSEVYCLDLGTRGTLIWWNWRFQILWLLSKRLLSVTLVQHVRGPGHWKKKVERKNDQFLLFPVLLAVPLGKHTFYLWGLLALGVVLSPLTQQGWGHWPQSEGRASSSRCAPLTCPVSILPQCALWILSCLDWLYCFLMLMFVYYLGEMSFKCCC